MTRILNMFSRKLKGYYNNIYNFVKSNFMPIIYIKTILYFFTIALDAFESVFFVRVLQALIYIVLIFAEWFIAHYWYEKNQKIVAFLDLIFILCCIALLVFAILGI